MQGRFEIFQTGVDGGGRGSDSESKCTRDLFEGGEYSWITGWVQEELPRICGPDFCQDTTRCFEERTRWRMEEGDEGRSKSFKQNIIIVWN